MRVLIPHRLAFIISVGIIHFVHERNCRPSGPLRSILSATAAKSSASNYVAQVLLRFRVAAGIIYYIIGKTIFFVNQSFGATLVH